MTRPERAQLSADGQLLQEVGMALFGERWQTELSRVLSVSDRTVRRWLSAGGVPPGVFNELKVVVEERLEVLTRVFRAIERR